MDPAKPKLVKRAEPNEHIWFDGVSKSLLEAHTVQAPKTDDVDEGTLTTSKPLPTLTSLTKKFKTKEREKYEQKKQQQNGQSTSSSIKASSNGTAATSNGHNNNNQNKHKKVKLVNGSAKDITNPNTGLTDELALDCEMVECYHHKSVLARISIVNLFGHPVLDRYVAPPSRVTDYRTKYSGIRRRDIANAPDFDTVQKEVSDIIRGRIVVGHAIHNDFAVLNLKHPPELTRDTADYYKYLFQGKTPSLKKLSESLLGVKIQKGEHDSVQDAQATMKLYVRERDKWNEKLLKKNNPLHQKMNAMMRKHNKTKPMKKKIKTFYVTT